MGGGRATESSYPAMSVLSVRNDYYALLGWTPAGGEGATFRVALLPGSDVYRGHFPGRPVSPGVCQVELVRQCAERLAGQELFIRGISSCRFLAVASPAACPEMEASVFLSPVEGGFAVKACLTFGGKVYMDFKGEMSVCPLEEIARHEE